MKNRGLVAERILWVRQQAGCTQDEFAKIIGYSRAYLSNIEAGNTEPSRRFLKSLVTKLSHLKISIDWILTENNTPPYSKQAIALRDIRGKNTKKDFARKLVECGVISSQSEYLGYETGERLVPERVIEIASVLSGYSDSSSEYASNNTDDDLKNQIIEREFIGPAAPLYRAAENTIRGATDILFDAVSETFCETFNFSEREKITKQVSSRLIENAFWQIWSIFEHAAKEKKVSLGKEKNNEDGESESHSHLKKA